MSFLGLSFPHSLIISVQIDIGSDFSPWRGLHVDGALLLGFLVVQFQLLFLMFIVCWSAMNWMIRRLTETF